MDYKKDYYSILGLDNKATPEALRASYRRLAKLYHPDKNPDDPNATERFKAINEAYEVLSNQITRHIYDSYKAANKKEENPKNPDDNNAPDHSKEPFKTKKTKTYSVTREKRIYVHGTIEVKFQGEPELSNTYTRQWEQRFTIIPTEVLVTILSSAIYRQGPPKEYQRGYSTAELFTTPLKQPVNCKIITAEQDEYYQLDLYDIRVKDPVLKDITRHEQSSFGTLRGNIFGYTLYQYEEEVTEEYTEYAGATGHIETKTESGYTFIRQQFYAADGSTYWSEWKRSPANAGRRSTRQEKTTSTSRKQNTHLSDWSWLIVLLIIAAIWPPLLYFILPLIAGLLLLLLFGWIISAFDKSFPLLGIIIAGFIVLLAVRSLVHTPHSVPRTTSQRKFDSVSTQSTVIQGQNAQADTLITHNLRWEDRDSTRYELQLSVPLSALHRSMATHEQMNEQQYAQQGIGEVYRFMLNTDNDYTISIAAAFDSLAQTRALDRIQKASMIVSCIQSIPYSLIVDKSCSANYADDYISQYLANCEGDCCKGYEKFGVQSPVEFIADLKGDCDTRALLLYDILGKLGYQVALMTSNYYKHALIAVSLDKAPSDTATTININGKIYFLWETTSKGFGPGELPGSLSNTNYWNISLIQ